MLRIGELIVDVWPASAAISPALPSAGCPGVGAGLVLGFSRVVQKIFGPILLVHRQIALLPGCR